MAEAKQSFSVDDDLTVYIGEKQGHGIPVFLNLHRAALEKAKAKVRDAKYIVNSAVNGKNFGGSEDGLYEFAVIYEQKNYRDPDDSEITGDEHDRVKDANRRDAEMLKEDAIAGMIEYFTWFSGKESARNINKANVKDFNPEQDGEPKVSNFKIVEVDNEDVKERISKGKSPMLGFKMVYRIDREAEQAGGAE